MKKSIVIMAGAALALSACNNADTGPPGEEPQGDVDRSASYGSSSGLDKAATPEGPSEEDGTLGSDRVMQGSWISKSMAGDPAALFGEAETEASFSVRCDEGQLVFTRTAALPAGEASMALMAGGEVRTIGAQSTPDPLPTVTGRLPADDSFAAILAETADPIAVRVEDGPSLRMPSSAALREVVSTCRS